MGLHLILALQKHLGKAKGNKGDTVLVFDNEDRERDRFTDLIFASPSWTDSYYARDPKKPRLDRIVDVPYFGDSEEVYLLQVADLAAFFFRKHAELTAGISKEKYSGEAAQIDDWVTRLRKQSISLSAIYPKRGRCQCSELFFQYAVPCFRDSV